MHKSIVNKKHDKKLAYTVPVKHYRPERGRLILLKLFSMSVLQTFPTGRTYTCTNTHTHILYEPMFAGFGQRPCKHFKRYRSPVIQVKKQTYRNPRQILLHKYH